MPPARGVKKPKEDKSDHRVLANRYRVEKKLGSGSFGTAFLVYDMRANKTRGDEEWKVLKEIPCGELAPDETVGAMHEAKLLSRLQHPNIVRYYDSFLDGEFFCIITEYCEGGDLSDKITAWKKAGKRFDQGVVMDWFVQLVLAVQHMHKRKVLHRDLKTSNIFLKNNMIKIGDFGISRVLMGTTDYASTFIGTPYYMSPEVLKHEGYNSKSDLWSVACILYEICALQHAFEGQSLMGIMYKIVEGNKPEIPDAYHQNLRQLIQRLLEKDPSKRPSATEITKIDFVARHIEKMKNKIAEFKEHKDDLQSQKTDADDIARMLREKTHLEDLQNESLQRKQAELKHMTPRERMRLKKMQKADEKAKLLSYEARKNLADNVQRKTQIQEDMGTIKPPVWQGGTSKRIPWVVDNPDVYNDPAFRANLPPSTPDISDYHADDEYYANTDTGHYFDREEIGTIRQAPQQTLSINSSYDDRPITPMKKNSIDFDDPNISMAAPPGVKLLPKKKSVENGNKNNSHESSNLSAENKPKEQVIPQEILNQIPEDADAADTFYSQHEEFESDSDVDEDEDDDQEDDCGALMNCLQSALDSTVQDNNATITDDTVGVFSPAVRTTKIKNLRIECEKKLGKDAFRKAYAFLKDARFGDKKGGMATLDENAIMKGLRQFVRNPSDCFLVDQLLFLEEQAKMMK
ncbi:serine/threonine-protein kinase Nek11-like [Anneissia japonica]|uniref:serine/threonine-protein kinase Nek11-like n=1 Tax=Anneissia japonica TaxID=1529436 RepID=UPI001425A505|nr:serine/threonine-protein kinase Nek11-like [Anneissia japonica]XP_033104681.1 serine/threonine-protein kinase Nek11-like [Anneissia japonica]XP_033104690.1 serine/threonine-protein kinase Nek11-like [Anneissia japonica]